ncbi:hypothetical protein M433DRAFT_141103 [Acidomyces richmondensis BFW]|nr:MAG: hypothetical protein FE78DRAFT_75242 [Acidomyces sp. 'richmondensis']KYG48342.1 hypothetical protein M433DRAFT_141103 [Acidomyces richmondensis BFW]
MNFIPRLARRRLVNLSVSSVRCQSMYRPTEPPSNPHRSFYGTFGRPIAKNLLIALATFQILYLSWLKLESMEIKREKESEIHSLESELKSLSNARGSP